MGMRQIMALRQEQPEAKSPLGHIVREFYVFMNEGKYNPHHQVRVSYESHSTTDALNFFYRIVRGGKDTNNFIVKQERLPADYNIRAVVSRAGNVLVETSQLDLEKLRESIKESHLEVSLRERRTSVEHNDKKIIETTTRNAFHRKPSEQKDMRTLVKILPEYLGEGWEEAMQTLDLIYDSNCFIEPGENTAYCSSVNEIKLLQQQVLSQEQRMKMSRLLSQMQVPKLAFELKMAPYLKAKKIFNARILEMSTSELSEFLKKVVE